MMEGKTVKKESQLVCPKPTFPLSLSYNRKNIHLRVGTQVRALDSLGPNVLCALSKATSPLWAAMQSL